MQQGLEYNANPPKHWSGPFWELMEGVMDPFGRSLGPSLSGIIASKEPFLGWDNYFSGMFVLIGFSQWDNFLPEVNIYYY